MLDRNNRLKKPRIAIHERDFQRLSDLAEAAVKAMPDVAEYLEHELERARIIKGDASQVVGMGSQVRYQDETTGDIHDVTLVYPAESDIGRGRVSVLTPIGAALLGLSAGQSIDWTTRSGDLRRLTVLSVGEAPAPDAAEAALEERA
jgi:regulator of nucleoside diphosphate kinase